MPRIYLTIESKVGINNLDPMDVLLPLILFLLSLAVIGLIFQPYVLEWHKTFNKY